MRRGAAVVGHGPNLVPPTPAANHVRHRVTVGSHWAAHAHTWHATGCSCPRCCSRGCAVRGLRARRADGRAPQASPTPARRPGRRPPRRLRRRRLADRRADRRPGHHRATPSRACRTGWLAHRPHLLVRPRGHRFQPSARRRRARPVARIGGRRPAGLAGRAGIDPPYVVLGWSYGGLVAQAYAAAYPEELARPGPRGHLGPRAVHRPSGWSTTGLGWSEGGRDVDTDGAVRAAGRPRLRATCPLAVLSQDHVRGKFRRVWLGYHDDLARRSTDGVHVVGIGSGHVMHEDVPDLVAAAVEAVWAAAADGSSLRPCDARFTDAGGRCRSPAATHRCPARADTGRGSGTVRGASTGPGRTARCR